MTRNEVIELLKAVTAGRHRTIGEPDITLWGAALASAGVTSLPDAMRAVVEFYAQETDWIAPAHVIQRVRAIRADRLRAAPPEGELMADVNFSGDIQEFLRIKRERLALIANGVPAAQLRSIAGGAA